MTWPLGCCAIGRAVGSSPWAKRPSHHRVLDYGGDHYGDHVGNVAGHGVVDISPADISKFVPLVGVQGVADSQGLRWSGSNHLARRAGGQHHQRCSMPSKTAWTGPSTRIGSFRRCGRARPGKRGRRGDFSVRVSFEGLERLEGLRGRCDRWGALPTPYLAGATPFGVAARPAQFGAQAAYAYSSYPKCAYSKCAYSRYAFSPSAPSGAYTASASLSVARAASRSSSDIEDTAASM